MARGGVLPLAALLAAFLAIVAPIHTARAAAIRYGADLARVQAAVQAAGWPEEHSTWCGIAASAAAINYRLQGSYATQDGLAAALDTAVFASAWGTPARISSLGAGPGFLADISRDIGADPRALSAGQADFTLQPYHQIISYGSAATATRALVADLVRGREPLQAFVLHGSHSVLVSGVLASNDHISDPTSILALEVWDPGFGQPNQNIQFAQMEIVPLAIWLTSREYWGTTYAANATGGVPTDPDPSVGPYAFDPAHGQSAHLWNGHFVYIRPDASSAPAAKVSPDWALDPSGAVIAGAHGELPRGYHGPAVALATGARISRTKTITHPGVTTRATAGIPWWLALGALPLLIGGLLISAAIRAQVRLRRAVELVARPSAAPSSPLWASSPDPFADDDYPSP